MIDKDILSIREGLDTARAVALETTIVTHGLPRPLNLDTAIACEDAITEERAEPATIAVWDGRLRVGIGRPLLARLAEMDGVAKTNLSNLGVVLARKAAGSTSVSTTLLAAHAAGIRVAATGGIGGVHRGFQKTFDLSADLTALARTPVLLVCAGAKSILDVAATREQLETLGVPVLGWGTEHFPLFYSPGDSIPVDARIDSAEEAAAAAIAHWQTGQRSAVLVVADPPAEHAVPRELVEKAVSSALAAAEEAGAGGRDATPFLLSRMVDLTQDASLRANLALIRNNCRIAARIAIALAGR